MSSKRLVTTAELHLGQRVFVKPRSPDVQRSVGRGVYPEQGEEATLGHYELDMIRSGALLPFVEVAAADLPAHLEPAVPSAPAESSSAAAAPASRPQPPAKRAKEGT